MLIQVIEDPSTFLDWKVIVLAIFGLAEAVVRVTPSDKDNSIINKVVLIGTYLLDFIVPNRRKTGGRFTLKKGNND